jgi:zinc protease
MAEVSAKGQLSIIERDQPQSMAVFGGPGIMMDDPEFFPAFVMNYILGGGSFASRLMEEVREKRGLAYGVSTSIVSLDYAGFFYGSVATENQRIAESLGIIKSELSRMADDGVSAEELTNAKTYLTGSFPLRFDSNSSIANQLVGYQLVGRPIDYINTRNAMVEAVTLDQVNKAAKRLLDPETLTIVVIGKPVGLGEASPSE